jgi:valyl-tRNA synthetase
MEALVNKICLENDRSKQKKLILQLMHITQFSHPHVLSVLDEFGIDPQALIPKHSEESGDKKNLKAFAESSFLQLEAQRLAKIEIIAEILQSKGYFSNKSPEKIKKTLQKNNKSYRSILESEPDIPLTIPLDQDTVSSRQITQQKKKLERLLKVSENIKKIKINQEKRRLDLSKDFDEKSQKIKQAVQALEEERNKRKLEKEIIRQSKLIKKYKVNTMQDIDSNEIRALEQPKYQKFHGHERSKTSLNVQSSRFNNQ